MVGWPDRSFDIEGKPGETINREAGEYGTFPVKVENLDPPRYAAFRWASAYAGADLTPTNSTLVELSLTAGWWHDARRQGEWLRLARG